MTYASVVTLTPFRSGDGRLGYLIDVSETDAAATSEYSVPNLPLLWIIVSYTTQLVSGQAATTQPILGTTASFVASTVAYIGGQAAAAAFVNDQTGIVGRGTGTLYVRSQPNAGTNNVLRTQIVLLENGQ